MRKKDVLTKEYLSDRNRFADLMNVFYFEGDPMIRAEDVQDMSSEVTVIRKGADEVLTSSGLRDILRKVACGMQFIVMGVEEQSEVHYAMPVRVMEYDTAEYGRQIREKKKLHREQKDLRGPEFLSGFSRKDRLLPTITLVLYFGEQWDGARSLHELLDFTEWTDHLRKIVADYPLHILEVLKYPDIDLFQTDLGLVFGFLQNAKKRDRLKEFIDIHKDQFADLREDAYDVIAVLANAAELGVQKKEYLNENGGIDMCQAIQEMIEEGRQEGRQEGMQEGRQKGRSEWVVSLVRKKAGRGYDIFRIAEELELDCVYIQKVIALISEDERRTDLQIADMLVRREGK